LLRVQLPDHGGVIEAEGLRGGELGGDTLDVDAPRLEVTIEAVGAAPAFPERAKPSLDPCCCRLPQFGGSQLDVQGLQPPEQPPEAVVVGTVYVEPAEIVFGLAVQLGFNAVPVVG
jgi:hypothetical protein